MIELYHCNTSYASQKVRLYLVEKGISWKSHQIDLRKQEQITSSYRNINPLGLVPAVRVESGNIICGSTKIMETLEVEHPQPPLLPKSTSERALVHKICLDHEKLHDPSIRTLSYYKIFMSPENRKKMDIARVVKLAKDHPDPARGAFLERAAEGKLTKTEIDAAYQAVDKALVDMDHYLEKSGGHFIVDDQYTMADAVCTATIFRLEQVGMKDQIGKYPRILTWYDAMKARLSFKEAILCTG